MLAWLRRGLIAFGAVLAFAGIAHAQAPQVRHVPGKPLVLLGSYDLAPLGYEVEEYFVSGKATSYTLAGPPTEDGKWQASPSAKADYVTRIVVVRPTDPRKFNGSVLVEWNNVTAGTDASPEWTAAHRLLIREGYAYVGVSAQKAGVEGGGIPGMAIGTPLKRANAARYGTLSHPGDAWSFDIFSEVGRLLRAPNASGVLGTLVPRRIIAGGESQSAAYLTTYINAVDPIARLYDAFLVHSRFGSAAPIEGGSMGSGGPTADALKFVKFRPDLRVPVIAVITETDLLGARLSGYHGARRPDDAKLRVWEVPGTAHADNYTFVIGSMDSGSAPIEKIAAAYEPMDQILGSKLAKPINFAPQHHYLVETAVAALDAWLRTGKAPPRARSIQLTPGADPTPVVDANGAALGGVRTPWVDVPTAKLTGVGNSGSPLAMLVGTGEPFDTATLDRLYPGGKAEYLAKFEKSLDASIKVGFILPADRAEILALAAAMKWRGSK